jgi:gluconolactonase
VQLDDGMAFPNGIVVDQDSVYVAETFTRTVWHYSIASDGTAASKRRYCTLPGIEGAGTHGPDGMTTDDDGNLYVAHYGSGAVYVFGADGEIVDMLKTAGIRPTNVCFGGAAFDRLYVTIDDTGTLVEYTLSAHGKVLPFCPSRAESHPFKPTLEDLA